MSLSICSSCPSEVRTRCSRFNNPLHKPKKKGEQPILSEHEKVCILLKNIYVAQGHEEIFYEGGIIEGGKEIDLEQSREKLDTPRTT